METQSTNYSGLAGGPQPPEAYLGVTPMGDATNSGDYEKNAKGIKKPWILPMYRPPEVRPIG